MAENSRELIALDKPIEDNIKERQNKHTQVASVTVFHDSYQLEYLSVICWVRRLCTSELQISQKSAISC